MKRRDTAIRVFQSIPMDATVTIADRVASRTMPLYDGQEETWRKFALSR
jgi:hypothetical protein